MNVKTIKESVDLTIYIAARPPSSYNDEDMKRGYALTCHTFDWASVVDDAVLIGEVPVTIEVPAGVDVLTGMVESLKAKQQTIRATAEKECQDIETQIQSMLCIEHKECE